MRAGEEKREERRKAGREARLCFYCATQNVSGW
jgi:hypothetical protein